MIGNLLYHFSCVNLKNVEIIIRSMWNIIKVLGISFLSLILAQPCMADSNQRHKYEAVPGLIDLRSTFSDGEHSIEELVQIARSRGFKVLFINDHDRIALSYGIPPFRSSLFSPYKGDRGIAPYQE